MLLLVFISTFFTACDSQPDGAAKDQAAKEIDVKAEVRKIICDICVIKDEKLKNSDKLKDIIADELDLVDIIKALRRKFKIKVADDADKQWYTVHDVINFVEMQMRKKK